jgi:hypothetical protein
VAAFAANLPEFRRTRHPGCWYKAKKGGSTLTNCPHGNIAATGHRWQSALPAAVSAVASRTTPLGQSCARRSDDTEASSTRFGRIGRSDRRAQAEGSTPRSMKPTRAIHHLKVDMINRVIRLAQRRAVEPLRIRAELARRPDAWRILAAVVSPRAGRLSCTCASLSERFASRTPCAGDVLFTPNVNGPPGGGPGAAERPTGWRGGRRQRGGHALDCVLESVHSSRSCARRATGKVLTAHVEHRGTSGSNRPEE